MKEPTHWQKLTLQVPAHLTDTVMEILNEAGALAVTLESASPQNLEIFEAPLNTMPLWENTAVASLFAAEEDLALLTPQLENAISPHPFSQQVEIVVDQDWQKQCTDAFQPICFANRLWIYPSWHTLPDDDKPRVMLDPGLAFGTGSHPTTALCLEWLATHVQPGDTVVDYGCGSGILALAALKLGATQVWGVDIDPQAIEASLENAKRNQVLLHAVLPEQLPTFAADILIANILANPLINLAPQLAGRVKPGGSIALSGILSEQVERILASYQPWFDFSPPHIKEEWACVAGVKVKGRSIVG